MVPADAPCALRCRFVRMGLRGVMRRWRIPMNGGRCGCAIRWVMADDVVRQPSFGGRWVMRWRHGVGKPTPC